jgi:hypothetical protein
VGVADEEMGGASSQEDINSDGESILIVFG